MNIESNLHIVTVYAKSQFEAYNLVSKELPSYCICGIVHDAEYWTADAGKYDPATMNMVTFDDINTWVNTELMTYSAQDRQLLNIINDAIRLDTDYTATDTNNVTLLMDRMYEILKYKGTGFDIRKPHEFFSGNYHKNGITYLYTDTGFDTVEGTVKLYAVFLEVTTDVSND